MSPPTQPTRPIEPSLAALPNPVLRYFAATRPAFLIVTFFACLLGLAGAAYDGLDLNIPNAVLTVLFALVAHAGVNVLNDYFDAANGTDDVNTERIFPFTGGSRFIQNGVISRRAMGWFGYGLLGAVVPAGLWLTAQSRPGLILIGLCGLLIGWAYSAPPFKLASRGLGELAVACGWLLIVVGADFVQRGRFDFTPVAAGLGLALLIAKLLYINQFPDARADAQCGKRTVVTRLGLLRARWGYLALAVAAYGWVAWAIASRHLPNLALLAMLPAFLSAAAARILWRHAAEPRRLTPAIKLTILSAVGHGLLLSVILALSSR